MYGELIMGWLITLICVSLAWIVLYFFKKGKDGHAQN